MTDFSVNNNSPIRELPDLKTPLIFNVIEFLLIAGCIVGVSLYLLYGHEPRLSVYIFTGLTILIVLILLNRKFLGTYQRTIKQLDNQKKAQLYSYVFGSTVNDNSSNIIRERSIQYCQDLIDDYKATRRNCRNIYYVFQISTIVLSGLTPILVLLDKIEINSPLVRWLPVIFPAIAAIVTSISTSFPFQKNWVSANTTVELLEAEQEKFILGVTPAYRFFDIPDEVQRKQKVQESVESFINQVNTIHLNQLQPPQQESKSQSQTEGESNTKTEARA